jgi:serine/threonine-protein kinase RsbW
MASSPEMAQMATVELSFTPLPAHVRTARLVATAVARRSGVDESLLDEVRLAVGEACSRAVEAHRLHCPGEPVRIQLSDRDGRFEVVVADAVPGAVAGAAGVQAAAGDSAAGSSGADPAVHATAAAVTRIAAATPQPGPAGAQPAGQQAAVAGAETAGATAAGTDQPAGGPQAGPAAASGSGGASAAGSASAGVQGASAANGGLPADIGLAVIAGLADDVDISATGGGVSIRMSWPTA